MNGQLNGQLNGTANKSLQKGDMDAPVLPSKTRKSSTMNAFGAVVSIAARLLLWYSVITAIFRCPSSIQDLTDDSPALCKPYLQVRSQIAPHIEPHYNKYLKPYVDQSRPQVDRFNEKVFTPATAFTKQQYNAYAAPRVAQVQSLSKGAWASTVKPRLELRSKWAKEQYEQKLSKYVNEGTAVAAPYATRAKDEVAYIYETTLVPWFDRSLPFLQKAYAQVHFVVIEILWPHLQSVQQTTSSLLSRKLWPHIVILYGENVEPQLMRISERLGRYKDSKKLEAVVGEMETNSSSAISRATSFVSSAASAPIPTTSPSEKEKETDSREKIESDLKTWQKKFAQAADKGAEDLDDRVKEITNRQINNQAHIVGKAFVIRLEETAGSSIRSLKTKINDVVKNLPEDADEKEEEAAYEQVLSSIRAAGATIKDKAQAVRAWKQRYDNDTMSLVQAALQSTYNVIDNIRDLGLQEIGMRWAWMEGVTYQDWTKYHDLKSTFDEWRNGVERVAVEHKGLKAAQDEGETIQESGMEAAEKAAKELTRLKDVARWKIDTQDSSDNFGAPSKAKKIAQQVVDKAESVVESIADTPSSLSKVVYGSQGTAESLTSKASEALQSVVSAASTKKEDASSAIIGTPAPLSSIESEVSKVFGGAMAASVGESKIVLDNEFVDDSSFAEQVQSMLSAAGSQASDLTNAISAAVIPPTETQGSVESVASLASEQYARAMSAASSALYGPEPGAMDQISRTAADKYSQAITAYVTPTPSKSVQIEPLLEISPSPAHLEEVEVSSSKGVTSLIETFEIPALLEVMEVPIEPLLSPELPEVAAFSSSSEMVEEILHFPKVAVVPRMPELKAASRPPEFKMPEFKPIGKQPWASYAIYGTPTPVLQSLAAQASAQFDEAKRIAAEQFSKASIAIAGTPKPAYEAALSSIESAYSGSLSTASVKLQSALGYTASVASLWATPTQGTFESISSAASLKLQDGLSRASAQYESAKAAVGAQPTPAHQKYLAEAQKQYYQGIGLAHDRYSQFLTAASGAVYGTPTPAYQSWLSIAQAQYTSAASVASVKYNEVLGSASSVVGQTSKSPAQSILDSASSQYNAALSAASEALVAASSSASVGVYGTPTGKLESLASVASESLVGTETPWTEAAASQASQNWEALVSKASKQIYGAPTPWHESAWSQAGGYAAQATEVAADQYSAVHSLINDLVVGKEPDFTESVMNRLSAAYYTGAANYASSASSVANNAYASASSVIASVFTPPTTLEAILDSASEQLNAAVEAASVGIYRSKTGSIEKATSAAASVYGSVQSKASDAIYGTETGYAEAAQSRLTNVASSAQSAISVAIYGTPTGTVEAAASGAASVYSSVSSVAAENLSAAGDAVKDTYGSAASQISSAIYGPEQGAVESATNRLALALESAKARLSSMAEGASGAAAEQLKAAQSNIEDMASSVSSVASAATSRVKDEL